MFSVLGKTEVVKNKTVVVVNMLFKFSRLQKAPNTEDLGNWNNM